MATFDLKEDYEEIKRQTRYDHNCYEGDTYYVYWPYGAYDEKSKQAKKKVTVAAVDQYHVTLRFQGGWCSSVRWKDFEDMKRACLENEMRCR